MSRRAEVYEMLTDDDDRLEARRCIVCQVLEQDPDEQQLHRLVRLYEARIGDLSQRLVDTSEVWQMQRRIDELETVNERQQLTIQNLRRKP